MPTDRETARLRLKEWRAKNPERAREHSAKWRRANRQKFADSHRRWRQENEQAWRSSKDKYDHSHRAETVARATRWRVENPWASAAATSRRRSAKRQAVPAWADFETIAAIYRLSELLTRNVGVQYHVDHIVLLRSVLVCGLHTHDNLTPLPAAENISKSNRVWPGGPSTFAEHRATVEALKREGYIQTTRNDLTTKSLRSNVMPPNHQPHGTNHMADALNILLPPGRIIMGDVYKGSDKDDKGQPRLVKSGANKGQQYTQYFIGVAIPKAGEQAWWQTAWGQQLMAVGAAGYPNFYQNPAFSWKIEDGDSTIPNKKNQRPCDREGAKGHWILKFSSQFAPPVYQQPSPGVFERVDTPGLIKTGWWVQVNASAKPNTGDTPGIYLNQQMVLFVKQDTEITSGPDAATAFAGATVAQLPGATALPFTGAAAGMPHPGMAAMPGTPAAGMPMQPGAMPGPAMQPAAGMTMVQPNPGFLAGPGAMPGPGMQPAAMGAPGMPMAPGMPPGPAAAPQVPAGPQMTPQGIASGFTLAQYQQQGWNEQQLRQNGIIY